MKILKEKKKKVGENEVKILKKQTKYIKEEKKIDKKVR